jgi:O-antigen/teichoic acid export membrane protein
MIRGPNARISYPKRSDQRVAVLELINDLIRYIPGQVIPALIGFATIPIITNMFPPDVYGDYRLVLTTVALLSPWAGWLSYGIPRFYPEFESAGHLSSFYGTVIRLQAWFLVISASIWAVALIVTGRIDQSLDEGLFAAGLALLAANVAFGTVAALVRSRREPGWFSLAQSSRAVLELAIGVAFVVIIGTGISGFMWGSVLAGLAVVPLMWWRSQRNLQVAWSEKIDRGIGKAMLRYSFPLILSMQAVWLLRLSDRYLLELFRGSAEVGIYAASYGLAETGIGTITAMFLLPFYVLGSRIFENEGSEPAGKFMRDTTRIYMLVAIPAVVGLSVLARPLVVLTTGPEYTEGYRIVPFVAASMLIQGIAHWRRSAFLFYKKTTTYLLTAGLAAAVNVGLNLILIPRYGFVAAGITTLIGYITLDATGWWLSRRLLRWKFPVLAGARTLGASLLMGVVVWWFMRLAPFPLVPNLVLAVALGVVIMGGLLRLLGEVKPEDLRQIKDRFRTKTPVPSEVDSVE